MDFSKLEEFLDTLPGIGIPTGDMTVWQNHKEIYRHSTGIYGLPDPDGLYYLYSNSKIITVCAAMTLFEKGEFVMSTPVADFLPEYADYQVMAGGGIYTVPGKKPITMKDLFCMTSGLGFDVSHPLIAEAVEKTGGRCPTREFIREIARIPFSYEPGERYLYGFSHDILAAVVEEISGESFNSYVKHSILDPLGMKNTTFVATDEVKAKMVPEYIFNDRQNKAMDAHCMNPYVFGPEYESGGAGGISSLNDMATLADALTNFGMGANGNRILRKETVEYMRTPKLTPAQRSTFAWKHLIPSYTYGLGMRVLDNPYGHIHMPVGEFGWAGAAGALFVCSPELGISAYYAQHMLNDKEDYVHPRLLNLLAECCGN